MKAAKKAGKARMKSAFESRRGFLAAHYSHRLVWAASSLGAVLRRRQAVRKGTAILCPPGGGNIGDQALVESAAWNSQGPVTLLVRSKTNYVVPDWLLTRGVTTRSLPHLLYGIKVSHFRDVLRFLAVARRSESLIVIGADIMDGRYSAAASVNRWSLAILASACGADTSVLGFSWNSSPTPSSQAGMLKADPKVSLWVRDPVSLRRTRETGASQVRLCSDIVFAHPALELPTRVRRLPDALAHFREAGEYAVVNASGFIGSDIHVVDQYRAIIRAFRDTGIRVVLLPHVMRGFSDLDCLRPFDLADGSSFLVDQLLTPAQVSELAAGARLIVTGRMHLAVLASLARTPVLTLASQGKVDGLYELLERPEWVLDSKLQFSDRVIAALEATASPNVIFPTQQAYAKVNEMGRLPFKQSKVIGLL